MRINRVELAFAFFIMFTMVFMSGVAYDIIYGKTVIPQLEKTVYGFPMETARFSSPFLMLIFFMTFYKLRKTK